MLPRLGIVLCAAALPVAAQAQTPQAVADELMAADRAFSASGEKGNLVDSIGAMLAPDAIMPTPQGDFATGKDRIVAALRSNPANGTSTAKWMPVRAGVSADGLHGFTYGFMTIQDAGNPERRAKYLSYWVKRPEGWRVAAYKRAPSGEGAVDTTVRAPALPVRLVAPDAGAAAAHAASLKAAEKAFSDRAQVVGVGPAFVEFGTADAMNMGRTAGFTFGNEAIGADIGAGGSGPPPFHWAADAGVLAASSGDLGVTWGFIRPHQPSADGPGPSPFFTIWRRAAPDQPWRYVAE